MKVIYGIKRVKRMRRAVVALGVFDGVHRAHRQILKKTVSIARRIEGQSVVVTFSPHPKRKVSLYSLKHRLRLISQLGIDVCIVIKFSEAFSKISAFDFVKDILIKKIDVDYICVGRNFRFGRGAKGNPRVLSILSDIYGFKLKVFGVIKIKDQPISSTYIRRLITRGKLKLAERLLCKPVTVLGTVIKGSSLATRLGFPTANIDPHHEVLPPSGVYAVRLALNHHQLGGICYIGTKPTFLNPKSKIQNPKHIEVHIFNFKRNLYGKYLEIQFIRKVRDEQKFLSLPLLCLQIKKDIRRAKSVLTLH